MNVAAECLAKFKIPAEMVVTSGVRWATDFEVRELMGVRGRTGEDLSGLVFPYRDPRNGRIVGHRVRLDQPLVDGTKYLAERGCRHLFFATTCGSDLDTISISVSIVEAEKSALAISALAARLGYRVLAIAAGGVWGWKRKTGTELQPDGARQPVSAASPSLDWITWQGREAFIVFDANVSGRRDLECAQLALAQELSKRGAKVLIATVPQTKDVNGLDDLIAVVGDKAALELFMNAKPFTIRQEQQRREAATPALSRRESAATKLIELAQSEAELFHAGENCFATVRVDRHQETYSLRSRGFRTWLSKRFFDECQRASSGEALSSAIQTLEGISRFQGPEHAVGVRIQGDDKVYLDLANEHWQIVEISSAGWRIVESHESAVRFRRPHGMLSLPIPAQGGNCGALQQFLNIPNSHQFLLATAWLIGSLHPRGPYPLLILHGEQGSAKTTTARFLRSLIDPNHAPVRSEPRDPRDLMIAANNGWVCAFDNLSGVAPWLSDALCRLSTGGGFSTRALFTDDEEIIFEAKRPAILTGIEELALRGDLLDRALIIDLPRIPEEARQSEEQFLRTFEEMRPQLLGALLDAVTIALANRHKVNLPRLPRMADFAIWVSAAEPGFTLESGSFLRAYTANRTAANELPLDTPLAEALRKLELPWNGTAGELLASIECLVDERVRRQRSWPASPRALSNFLRRLAPSLRQSGTEIEFGREAGTGRRLITLAPSGGVSSSQSSQAAPWALETQPHRRAEDRCPRDESDGCDDEVASFSSAGAGLSQPFVPHTIPRAEEEI